MASARTRAPGPILWRSCLKNTIYDVLKAREGWQETDSETEWDFLWADKGWMQNDLDKTHLAEWQRINHYPNHYELTRKDLLVKNLKRTKRQLEREDRPEEAASYAFFPQTFVVPSEYRMFVEEFKRQGGTWIMKPIGRAQGQGIFLFNRLSQISEWRRDHTWKPDDEERAETYLAQRYVDSPYLVGGRKFDLRIYALVTSYNPLRIYLYRSGFARFTNARYSMRKEDIGNTFVHLTNVAIQKHAPGFDRSKGMKWAIRSLRLYMLTRHGADATNELFGSIQALIVRTLLAVQPAMIHDKHCFELYGYDILIDSALKPWLIEVNASPSLSASDRADWTLKFGMLNDMLDLVDVEGRREAPAAARAPPPRQGGFDLIWDAGPPPPVMPGGGGGGGGGQCGDRPTSLPSLLGCHNPRDGTQARRPLAEFLAEEGAAAGGGGGGGTGAAGAAGEWGGGEAVGGGGEMRSDRSGGSSGGRSGGGVGSSGGGRV